MITPIHSNYKAMRYILQSAVSLAGREKFPSVAIDTLEIAKPLNIKNNYTNFVAKIANKFLNK